MYMCLQCRVCVVQTSMHACACSSTCTLAHDHDAHNIICIHTYMYRPLPILISILPDQDHTQVSAIVMYIQPTAYSTHYFH